MRSGQGHATIASLFHEVGRISTVLNIADTVLSSQTSGMITIIGDVFKSMR